MAFQDTFRILLTSLARLTTLLFAALAVFAFFETQAILAGSHSLDDFKIIDDELMIPMLLCFPKDFSVGGSEVSYDVSQGLECTQMDFLINACAASLLFGAVASVAYVIIDFMAHYNKGPFNGSAAAGMGIFLFFILIMTGITAGALVEQNLIWVDLNQKVLDITDTDITASAYGNLTLIGAAAVFAFLAGILDIIDLIVVKCWRPASTTNEKHTDDFDKPTAFPAQHEVEDVETPKEKKKGFKSLFLKKKKNQAADEDDDEAPTMTEPRIDYGENGDKPGWLN